MNTVDYKLHLAYFRIYSCPASSTLQVTFAGPHFNLCYHNLGNSLFIGIPPPPPNSSFMCMAYVSTLNSDKLK